MAAEFHKPPIEDTNDSKCFWGGGKSVFCLSTWRYMELTGARQTERDE